MNKLDSYISNESKLEQESRYKISGKPLTNYDDINEQRQKYRIYIC